MFNEDQIPEGVIPIGDDVFVFPATYQNCITVHLRRFQKFGKRLYPSKEGITINPGWLKRILRPGMLPKTVKDLQQRNLFIGRGLRIESIDFENYTFTQPKRLPNGNSVSKSIEITSDQWTEMMVRYNQICQALLNHVYASIDFMTAYLPFDDRPLDETMTPSADVSNGHQYLLEVLRATLYDSLKEKGCMKEPELRAEEMWGNSVCTFNETALFVDETELAESFYSRIWEVKDGLRLHKPAMYVTKTFLRAVRLQDILNDVRDRLCPPNTFEIFQDFE